MDEDECKKGLLELKEDLDTIKDTFNSIELDEKFILENKDTLKKLFADIYTRLEELKNCPLPAVKVEEDGKVICKDTSILLEPVVGRYIPTEDLIPEIDALLDAASVSKFLDRFDMLYKYVKSAAEGLTCELPKQVAEEDVPARPELSSEEDEEAVKQKAIELLELIKNPPRDEVSKRRQWFKQCMKEKLSGQKADDRVSWRKKFREAAKECATLNPYPKLK